MKNIILFIIIAILLSACNDDFLDVAPRSELSDATFWRNADDALSASVAVYDSWSSRTDGDIEIAVRSNYLGDTWSDDSKTSSFWNGFYYNIWGLGNLSPENRELNQLWVGLYKSIRRANVFLDNIDKPDMDENLRSRLTGEVKFIRAFQYHVLYNNFGGIPIVDRVLDVNELDVARASASETVAFILKDLDDAIASLPNIAPETGRITKGAAMALKARVLLYDKQWDEAAKAAENVIDLGVYALFPDYKQQFATANNNNSEQIVSWQYLISKRENEKPGLMATRFGFPISAPTQALVDTYETYDPNTDQVVANNPADPYVNRDPRFDASIQTGQSSTTGYAVNKFSASDVASTNVLIRYAEVLLTYAEAKIESGSIDQSVLDAINAIRARAYGVGINDTNSYPEITSTSQSELRTVVRNERRVELAIEGLRWNDIKRWRIAHGASGTMPQLEEKDYLRPIPQQQIDLSGEGVLTQNPGY